MLVALLVLLVPEVLRVLQVLLVILTRSTSTTRAATVANAASSSSATSTAIGGAISKTNDPIAGAVALALRVGAPETGTADNDTPHRHRRIPQNVGLAAVLVPVPVLVLV